MRFPTLGIMFLLSHAETSGVRISQGDVGVRPGLGFFGWQGVMQPQLLLQLSQSRTHVFPRRQPPCPLSGSELFIASDSLPQHPARKESGGGVKKSLSPVFPTQRLGDPAVGSVGVFLQLVSGALTGSVP
jgi:hypothetical protein